MTSSLGARTCGAFHRSMANTLPAWKTCSTSTPKRRIPSDPSSASMKARSSSSARYASQFRPNRASLNATITSTAATAPSISSSSSTCIVPGATSRSPSGALQKTTPNACASSSMSTIPMPSTFGSCRTTCRPTRLAPSMRLFRPPKPGAFCAAWSSTTPPSTPVGSTWSRSRSACCAASAWIAESTTPSGSVANSQLGNGSEMPPAPASNGCSQPTKPAPKWVTHTPTHRKSHNHCAEVLVQLELDERGPAHVQHDEAVAEPVSHLGLPADSLLIMHRQIDDAQMELGGSEQQIEVAPAVVGAPGADQGAHCGPVVAPQHLGAAQRVADALPEQDRDEPAEEAVA